MRNILLIATMALAGPALAQPSLAGPGREALVVSDTLAGSPFRVDIPADWNGELVMLLHGYEPSGVPRATPWPQNEAAPVFLARGYAVAAPAYSAQGWAIAEALRDIEALRRRFAESHGAPERTWLAGFSMGGLLALASVERHPEAYDGALSLCGVNMPTARVFENAVLTPLVAFDRFFPGVLPDLDDPASPPMIDSAALEATLAADEATAARLAERLQIARPALSGALMLGYLVLSEMRERAGGFPADNRERVYAGFGDDAAFNREVTRYAGDPQAVDYAEANAPLTGRIEDPVVLLSNRNDPTVPARFNAIYPALVEASGAIDALTVLPTVGEGHCDFTAEQIGGAFDTLTGARDAD